jgi:hypothetical protein
MALLNTNPKEDNDACDYDIHSPTMLVLGRIHLRNHSFPALRTGRELACETC